MSTKIYSGYILDEGMNPFEMINAVKDKFIPPIQKSIYENYLANFVRLYDIANYNDGALSYLLREKLTKEKQGVPASFTAPKLSLMARKETESEIKDEAYEYQVEILFAQDPQTKRYLTYFMGSQKMESKFKRMKGISEYCYYNNTDEPDGVSEDDWQERGNAWNRSVNLDEPLVNSMLSLQVLSAYDRACNQPISTMMKLKPAFPDREWRIGMLVNRLLVEGYFEVNPDADRGYANIIKAQSDTSKSNSLWTEVERNLGEDLTASLLEQKVKEELLNRA